jgi:hypothetical protein
MESQIKSHRSVSRAEKCLTLEGPVCCTARKTVDEENSRPGTVIIVEQVGAVGGRKRLSVQLRPPIHLSEAPVAR